VWVATGSDRLSRQALQRIGDESAELLFSAANIWEVAIKSALEHVRPKWIRFGRPDML